MNGEMYYATLTRNDSIVYGVFAETTDKISKEVDKVSRSGDYVKVYHGYFDLVGNFVSETDEPYNEYEID